MNCCMTTTRSEMTTLRLHREKVWFRSGNEACAAWHYPGDNGAVVVMTGGFAVPKEPATDRFAAAFHAAGFSVLAFDPRRIGESGGQPRQVVRIKDQLADWDAALEFAACLPGVARTKVAAWAFSLSGGLVLAVAARSALRVSSYRPGRVARRIECPLLVVACESDQSALAAPAVEVAKRARHAELVVLPGGHYAPFMEAHDDALAAELAFLRAHLLDG